MSKGLYPYQKEIKAFLENKAWLTNNSDSELSREILQGFRSVYHGALIMPDVDVWHPKLSNRFEYELRERMYKMVEHFTPVLTHDQARELLISQDQIPVLKEAGKLMHYTDMEFSYNLADKLGVRVHCHGSKDMPTFLMPSVLRDINAVLDYMGPLIAVNSAWIALVSAFRQMPDIMNNTREMNVYFPWLKLLLPSELVKYKRYLADDEAKLMEWVGGVDRPADQNRILRQFDIIRSGTRPNKFTWFPRELVRIANTGATLITQYNILKGVTSTQKPNDGYVTFDLLSSVEMDINELITKARNGQNVSVDIETQDKITRSGYYGGTV